MPIKFQCANIISISVCHITAKQFHYSSTCKKKCCGSFHKRTELSINCRYFILGFWSLGAGVCKKLISTWSFFPPIIFIIFYLDVGYNNLACFILADKILPCCFISIKSSFVMLLLTCSKVRRTPAAIAGDFFSFHSFEYVKKLRSYTVNGYRICSII